MTERVIRSLVSSGDLLHMEEVATCCCVPALLKVSFHANLYRTPVSDAITLSNSLLFPSITLHLREPHVDRHDGFLPAIMGPPASRSTRYSLHPRLPLRRAAWPKATLQVEGPVHLRLVRHDEDSARAEARGRLSRPSIEQGIWLEGQRGHGI
jgi:hypothetical protein